MQLIFNSPMQTGGNTYTGNDGVGTSLSASNQTAMINNQSGLPTVSYQRATIAPIYYILGVLFILWVIFK